MPSITILGLIGNELINFINAYERQSLEAYIQMIPKESLINEFLKGNTIKIGFNVC